MSSENTTYKYDGVTIAQQVADLGPRRGPVQGTIVVWGEGECIIEAMRRRGWSEKALKMFESGRAVIRNKNLDDYEYYMEVF